MKSCLTERDFNRYLEDSLTPSEIRKFEAHIESCGRCRKEYASWKELKDSLHAASEIQMPLNFKDKVMARVATEKIGPAAAGAARRGAALAFVSLILLYLIVKPVFGPYIDNILMDIFKSLSANLYAALMLAGFDPSAVITLFGDFMAHINTLLPIFAMSTLFMIASFAIIIVKGRTSGQHGA